MPSVHEQAQKVAQLLTQHPMKGNTVWYLIHRAWWERFVNYTGLYYPPLFSKAPGPNVGLAAAHPGPICNTPLLDSIELKLRPNLAEIADFIFVPTAVWCVHARVRQLVVVPLTVHVCRPLCCEFAAGKCWSSGTAWPTSMPSLSDSLFKKPRAAK